jgi:hypothetical protein
LTARKTKEELFQDATDRARRYARFHQGKSGRPFTEEEISDAAVDGYLQVLSVWAGSVVIDDEYLGRAVEAALGRQRRQQNRARFAESYDDGDERQNETIEPRVSTQRALVHPDSNVAREIAKLLERFEEEIYHAIRGGGLFRTQEVRMSGDHLREVAMSFAQSVAPVPRRASSEELRLWNELSPDDRRGQIDATRALYEGSDASRVAAGDAIPTDSYRLVRAAYWRDAKVTGVERRTIGFMRQRLRRAEELARSGRGAGYFAQVPSRTLQLWIVRRARGKDAQLTGDATIDAGLSRRDRLLVLDEKSYYRPTVEKLVELAGLTSVDVELAVECIAEYRRRRLVVRCAVCDAQGLASEWLECNHNRPKFDARGRQVAGVDLRGRGGRTPREALMLKVGASKGFEKLRFVDYSGDRRIQDAASRLAAWALRVLGLDPSVRHVLERIRARQLSRQIAKVLKSERIAPSSGERHPAFRRKRGTGRRAK